MLQRYTLQLLDFPSAHIAFILSCIALRRSLAGVEGTGDLAAYFHASPVAPLAAVSFLFGPGGEGRRLSRKSSAGAEGELSSCGDQAELRARGDQVDCDADGQGLVGAVASVLPLRPLLVTCSEGIFLQD